MMPLNAFWDRLLVCLVAASCFLISFSAHSSQPAQLIGQGSQWHYLDTGRYPGPAWTSRLYDETGWRIDLAQFGYGEGDENTVVDFGPDPDTKYTTTWFRKSFFVSDASVFNQLNLALLRDDGAIVYLNGFEIYRDNMPSGPILPSRLAVTNVAGIAEQTFFPVTLPSTALVNGLNVLAVEIHQAAADSIDLSFDLELSAANVMKLTRGPYLQRGTPTNIIVRWRTNRDTLSRVRFGTEPGNLSNIAEDLDRTSEHALLLTGLQPDTKYFYSVESDENTLGKGDSFFFVTSPIGAKPTRVWVLGDPGTATIWQQMVRDSYYNFAGTRHTDIWLMLGDNAYDSGMDSQYQTAVFDTYPEMLRKSVLWPTIGNHDTYTDFQLIDFPYLHIFSLPTQGEAGGVASGTKRYYSFDYGNIHFVCLDSMSSTRTPGSPMLQWLEQDLSANTNDWLVAFWHHPPYSKGSHDSDYEVELVEMRQYALPILERHGVDLVLSGHSHAYERSYLLNGHYGVTDTLTPAMVLNPGDGRIGGNGPYRKPTVGPVANQGAVYVVAGSSGQTSGGSLDHPAMFVSLNLLGSMVLDINRNTLTGMFLNSDAEVSDYFTIEKGRPSFEITDFWFEFDVAYLSWNSEPGAYYMIEYTDNLEFPTWTEIGGPVFSPGDGAEWWDSVPTDHPGYFRVRRVSP